MVGSRSLLRRFLPALLNCLFLILLIDIPSTSAEEGHCIWYGLCSRPGIGPKRYCMHNGTAQPIQAETRSIIEKYCPDIAAGGVSCCDNDQLMALNANIGLAENILGRCPTCFHNFLHHICAMTCSPTQSDFIKPVKTTPFNATHERIDEIDYHLSTTYKEATYNSCAQIEFPPTNHSALDLMCGEWASENCTTERWFTFMGDAYGNPFVPFQINYIDEDTPGFKPFDPETRSEECPPVV